MDKGSKHTNPKDFLERRSLLNAGAIMKDVESFRKDEKSFLHAPERDELRDVKGKTLLHLQSRSGLETLSWARQGARVVGVDFDEHAVARANSLAQEKSPEAEFFCANIYDLPQISKRVFDIIYTAYGSLFWLSNLKEWGRLIARYLAPKGIFYLVEYHPMANLLDESFNASNPVPPQLRYPYAHILYQHSSQKFGLPPFEYQGGEIWNYTLGDVLQSLIEAKLRIISIKEHDYMFAKRFEQMKQDKEGNWKWSYPQYQIPLLFSLKATH